MSAVSTNRLEPQGPTNYEVHRRTSAGWEFRTVRLEMEEAIAEAKRSLELPGTEAVRVVRDHYDPTTNSVRPNTVFRAAASPYASAKRSIWTRLRLIRPAAGGSSTRRPGLVGGIAASLIVVALGTAVTLLHS